MRTASPGRLAGSLPLYLSAGVEGRGAGRGWGSPLRKQVGGDQVKCIGEGERPWRSGEQAELGRKPTRAAELSGCIAGAGSNEGNTGGVLLLFHTF